MKRSEFFWLIGLLEGEGSFIAESKSAQDPYIQLQMTDEDVVHKVYMLMGGTWGKCSKPKKEHWKQVFYWRLRGRRAVEFMKRVKPYMSVRRQQQIQNAIDSHTQIKYKIDKESLEDIKQRLENKETHRSIAMTYNVDRSTITHIANGKVPKWLQ